MISITLLKPVGYLLETELSIPARVFYQRAKSQHYLKVTRDVASQILKQLQADPFCWNRDNFRVKDFRIYILIEDTDKSVIWDLFFFDGVWRKEELTVTKNSYFYRLGRALIIYD